MWAFGVARALYDFHSSTPGDLQFNSDEVVLIKGRVNKDWFQGESLDGGRRGIFPVNYVFEVKLPKLTCNDSLLIAIANFEAQTPADLSIRVGDVIVGKTRIDNNWWRGELSNKRGLFPACHVQPLTVAKGHAETPFQAIVKNSLKAQLPDEIDLNEGEVVVVEQLLDDSWCRGSAANRRGIFPLAFVERIQQPPIVADAQPKAHGITKYKFAAKCSGELSFDAGQKVTLVGHVDDEWTLCKIGDKAGIAPTSYISITVDCPKLTKSELQSAIATVSGEGPYSQGSCSVDLEDAAVAVQSCVGQIMRVAYDFCSATVGDLIALTDDYVRVTKILNDHWVEAVNLKNQRSGIIPISYLAPLVNRDNPEPTVHWRHCSDNGQLDRAIARTMLSLEIDSKSARYSNHLDSHLSSPTCQSSIPYWAPTCRSTDSLTSKAIPPPRPKTLPSVADAPNPVRLSTQSASNDNTLMKAVDELLHSEREYLSEITALRNVCDAHKEELDLFQLTLRLGTIVDLSSKLVRKMEQSQSSATLAHFGQTFYDMSCQLASAYVAYCNAQEESLPRLLQASADGGRAAAVEALMRDLRSSCQCFDLNTTLVRPIQRFLKYPLYLVGLLRNADPASEAHLKSALCRLSSASKLLNENKRRNDIVKKYREECERSFADRLSKFNVHSMRKKSSRLGVLLSSTFGLTQLRTNEQFDHCVNLFNEDVGRINAFSQHVQATVGRAMSTLSAHRAMVEALDESTVGSEMCPRRANALRNLSSSSIVQELTTNVRLHVTEATCKLQSSARTLAKLIDKRRDKLFDWEVATNKFQKATKSGDYAKLTTLSEQMKNAQAEYDALNEQLIVDLASFHTVATSELETARTAFVHDLNRFTAWLAEQLQSVGARDHQPLYGNGSCASKPIEHLNNESPLISFEEDGRCPVRTSNPQPSTDLLISPWNNEGAYFASKITASSSQTALPCSLKNSVHNNSCSRLMQMTSSQSERSISPLSTCNYPTAAAMTDGGCQAEMVTTSVSIDDDVDEFCVVAYDFQASGPDELSVFEDDIVVVHDRRDLRGNADWWLVESEVGAFQKVLAGRQNMESLFLVSDRLLKKREAQVDQHK
uniref:Dynamin-binding protein n=1 Tax=Trichuris muris TaxID=70415 RepID=A0A5S6R4V8_TRIMR